MSKDRRMAKHLFGLFFLLNACLPKAFAADLIDVYHQALDNDPTFKAAYSTFLSESESLPQAWSSLMPQLTLTALTERNYEYVNSGGIRVQQTYNGKAWSIITSQDLFNYQAWEKVQEAKASVKASMATFNDAAQNLILNTADAYFQLLLARDTLNFAEAKKRANKRQLDEAQERFNVGLDAITPVYEAKAAYDQSVSQVISAENNLSNQNQNLSRLTNHVYDHVSALKNNTIPLVKPEPAVVDEWIATGLKQNYNLFAAKYSMQAARENIKSASSGTWPVLSIDGSTVNTSLNSNPNTNSVASSFFVPALQKSSGISLNLKVPVFQGGLVASQTRQAEYDFQTSSQQMEKIYRDVVVNSTIYFNTIIDGIHKVKADRQTIVSQQNSLDSVFAQYSVGTRTMTDVVLAQENLFDAQRQQAEDQYNLINAILRLKYYAGTLNVGDLEEINSWLDTVRLNKVQS